MTQKDFSSGTYANEVDLSDYEPDLIEKFGVIQEKITKTVTRTIGRHIDSEVWFPWLVLGGIVLYFLLSLLLTNTPRLALAVKYLILTFVFLIEVVYIALLGNGFWFCEPEQVGWLKAILFTLVTLGVVFVEFNLFFSLLAEMKTESRDFNTSIGVILFTVIALVMFVYALFSGGLSDGGKYVADLRFTRNTSATSNNLGSAVKALSAICVNGDPIHSFGYVRYSSYGFECI